MFKKNISFILLLSISLLVSCSESSTGSDPGNEDTTGTLEVSVLTSGNGTDEDGFTITQGDNSKAVDPGGTVIFDDLEEGSYSIELTGLDMGCTVDGDNPVSVDVTAGETADIIFEITCEESMAEGTIAFSQRTDENTYNLFVMDADGSNKQQLTNSEMEDSWVALSPDGEKIAFVRRDMASSTLDNEIWVIDIDGGTPVQLTSNDIDDKRPAWSPDGSQIAFESDRDDNSISIFVMDADGTNQVRITDSAGHDHSATWSPDNTIAFVSDRKGENGVDIYKVNSDGTGLEILIDASEDNGNNLFQPAWSPDGSQIAYEGYTTVGHSRIFVADATGNNAEILTSEDFSAYQPSWSPDGKYIAFMDRGDNDTTDAIWTIKTDGTLPFRITDEEGPISAFPSWGPTVEQ